MIQRLAFLAGLALFVCAQLSANEFYVSPTGTHSGDGSINNPWDLQTALSQPSTVHAGDIIWLRGGTYAGTYVSHLDGTAAAPIVVRQYPGERATLDGGNSDGDAILTVDGDYTWFWGFEIMSSDPNRTSTQTGSWPSDINRGDGVDSSATPKAGNKLINLAIHDTRQGVSAFVTWQDTEINGCLIYYNGWDGPDNGHGHGIYTQNQTGTKSIIDSVIFHQFSHGIHAYGSSSAYLNNYHVEGNTLFMNGDLETHGSGRSILLGGDVVTNNVSILSNSVYHPPGGPASDFDLGYAAGCSNATMQNNYTASNTYLVNCSPVSMTGNTYYGNTTGFTHSQYPNNTYQSGTPATNAVFVRPNQYEFGRANITIFNWTLSDSVSVDLTGVAYPGGAYQIRSVEDFFGTPVASGTYTGGSVSIPMTGTNVAAPVGWTAPSSTRPHFGAFVLLSLQGPNDFFDVSPANPFLDDIRTVAKNGITVGCGSGDYCPESAVRRDQMAVFLLKAAHGSDYVPPTATGTVFSDVPSGAFAAAWIEEAKAEGIVSGCGGNRFCPASPVTRAQMAVLLLKADLGGSYTPPSPTGAVFNDVHTSTFAAAWIEDLAGRGITAGCGGGRYCPTSSVSRAQMSAFLVRTFNLQ